MPRQVFYLAGYDPITPQEQYERFARELKRFDKTWGARSSISDPQHSGLAAAWRVASKGQNWEQRTSYELMIWDDLVRGDFERRMLPRLLKGAHAFFDLFATGTLFRYAWAGHRYAIFAILPLLQMLVLAGCAGLAGYALTLLLPDHLLARAMGWLLGLVLFFALLHWPGKRWGLPHALDDWIFWREFLYGKRPDVEARLRHFAERLTTCVLAREHDEVVLVGHSFGATFAIKVLGEALARDSDLGRRGVTVCLLTVGSTVAKLALHPRGERLREHTRRLVEDESISWAEHQARDDAIAFYKFDPASLTRVKGDQLDRKPVIRIVQFHDMLTPETFARYRYRFLRLHYQPVMANDKPSVYDYFLAVCGPVPFAEWTVSRRGLLDFMTPEGSLVRPLATNAGQLRA